MLSAETESFKEDNDIGTVTWNTAYYFQKKREREREREYNRSVVVSIGNSMICSDIWHKYHE